ncbi:hypothetical protein ScPMuIL_008567 [Solemya velum]
MKTCSTLWNGLTRKKTVSADSLKETKLKRCLNVFDLVCLGAGSTLGVGVYVIIAQVAKEEAGPAIVISVLVAGVTALLSGLCYAEFSARLPRAGSAYVYTYVTISESCAFLIGWNMILEHMIGAAVAAKAWTQHLDHLLNNTIHRYSNVHFQWTHGPGMAEYPDLFAFTMVILAVIFVILGAKVSSIATSVFTILNVLVVLSLVCVGFFHVEHENWTDPPGFFPYGFSGVMTGAATLVYAFSGIDTVASSSEEVKEPSKYVHSAIISSIVICFVLFFGTSAALTLTYPWQKLADISPLPTAYDDRGIYGSGAVIATGGLFGLTASLIASLVAVPRILYAMGNDKLIFRVLSYVNPITQTPLAGSIVSGLFSAVIALMFRIDLLVEILAIGTLAAFSVVALGVICLRYQTGITGLYQEYDNPDDEKFIQCTEFMYSTFDPGPGHIARDRERKTNADSDRQILAKNDETINGFIRNPNCLSNHNRNDTVSLSTSPCTSDRTPILTPSVPRGSTYQRLDSIISSTGNGSISSLLHLPSGLVMDPNESTWRTVSYSLVIFLLASVMLCLLAVFGSTYIRDAHWWAIILVLIFVVVIIIATITIAKQPQNNTKLLFWAPYVPFLPITSLLLNIYLMTSLSQDTWIRFAVWVSIGLLIYFGYGIRHSVERELDEQEVVLYEISEQRNGMEESIED